MPHNCTLQERNADPGLGDEHPNREHLHTPTHSRWTERLLRQGLKQGHPRDLHKSDWDITGS